MIYLQIYLLMGSCYVLGLNSGSLPKDGLESQKYVIGLLILIILSVFLWTILCCMRSYDRIQENWEGKKIMERNYKVGDVVYVVDQFRVIKSIIDSITLNITKSGTTTTYNVYPYAQQKIKYKVRPTDECYIVNNLEDAIQSAKLNSKAIFDNVEFQLDNMTEDSFKIIEPEETKK